MQALELFNLDRIEEPPTLGGGTSGTTVAVLFATDSILHGANLPLVDMVIQVRAEAVITWIQASASEIALGSLISPASWNAV